MLQQYVFCITSTELPRLTLKSCCIKSFSSHTQYRQKLLVQVHKMTPTCYMKSRAAGFSEDRGSKLLNFLHELMNINLMPLKSMHIMWIKLLERLRRKLESDMEKWKITDLANLKCKDRNQYNSCLICQCCWLLCTSYIDTKQQDYLKTYNGGHCQDFFFNIQLREQLCQKRIQVYKLNITACINVYFPKLCLQSIGGNSVDIHGSLLPCMDNYKVKFLTVIWSQMTVNRGTYLKQYVVLCTIYSIIAINNN